ncbi:MAG: type 1 glutamine amidotransferase [Spirochaetales bacterium]|nr:type 1 glutamine amidotransferase [Spirochaetales bacterium]
MVILLEDLFEDLEFWYPCIRMREEGFQVISAAPQEGTYHGKQGLSAEADTIAEQVSAEEVDALIIPGGYSPDRMRRHAAMVKLVKAVFDRGKPVAAICHGGWMLASAGVLKDKKATGFFSIKDDMENAGARWVDQEVAVDGNLITSRNPGDLPAFCKAIIRQLLSPSRRI